MNTNPPDGAPHPAASFPSSRSYLAIGLAFVAFAIYGSLLPFELQQMEFGSAWALFWSGVLVVPAGGISRTDVLANVLLFMPIGFSLAGARLVDRGGWRAVLRSTLIVLALSVSVSCVAEFLQMFASDRVPSGLDIAAQSVGCSFGIVLWGAAGQEFTDWVRDALSAAPGDRISRLLVAAAAAWIFVSLAPFDLTLDLGELAERVRTKQISLLPFTHQMSGPQRLWDIIAETLSTVPLGLLGVTAMQARRLRVWPGAFLLGVSIVVVVESTQVFIKSHSANTGDALLGALGVAAGAWIGARVLHVATVSTITPASTGVSWRAVVAVAAWCVVLGAYHWVPYDFSTDNEVIRRKLARISILPFAGYLQGSYLNALNNVLTKLALAVPLGVAASFVTQNRRIAFLPNQLVWLVTACLIFGVIEGGQFFLPSRVPDPSDVLVGVVGAFMGLAVGRWLRSERGEAG